MSSQVALTSKQDKKTAEAKKYNCQLCEKIYNNEESLKIHIAIHRGDWKCSMCDKAFTSKAVKKRHERICEDLRNKVPQFTCRICKEVFNDLWVLNRHFKKSHTNRTFYECKICGYLVERQSDLKRHESRRHNDIRNYKCHVCEKAYKTDMDLLKHKKLHKDKYKCEVCGVFLESAHRLKQHNETHNKEATIKCLDCELMFKERRELDEHVGNEHPGYQRWECKICGKRFSTRENHKNHLITQHSDSKRYKCEICAMEFHFGPQFRRHLGSHQRFETDKQYNCFYCDQAFTDVFTLRIHINNFHKNKISEKGSGKKEHTNVYSCSKCSWKGYLAKLLVHFKTHDEEALRCKYCSVEFVLIVERKNHEKTHLDKNGQVHFNCHYCPAKFEDKIEYVKHYRMHISESRKYRCKYCPRNFRTPKMCAQHIIRKHKEELANNTEDQLTVLERVIIEVYGFESELDPHLKRNDEEQLAFRCRNCKKKLYGCQSLNAHYLYSQDCKYGSHSRTTTQAPLLKKRLKRKESNRRQMDDSDDDDCGGISDEQSECDEELMIGEIEQLPEETELTPLPLASAVYQYIERDNNSCMIIWCKKLEVDLATLAALNSQRLFICVDELPQKKITKSLPSLKVTHVTLAEKDNKFEIAIVYSARRKLNTVEFSSIMELEKTLRRSSKCERVIHFVRYSQFESLLPTKTLTSKLIRCNHLIGEQE